MIAAEAASQRTRQRSGPKSIKVRAEAAHCRDYQSQCKTENGMVATLVSPDQHNSDRMILLTNVLSRASFTSTHRQFFHRLDILCRVHCHLVSIFHSSYGMDSSICLNAMQRYFLRPAR